MAQYSVYQNKNIQTKKSFPYLLDVQSDLLSELVTTVVIPLAIFDQNRTKILTRLTPVLNLDQNEFVVLTPQLAGMQRKDLGQLVFDASHAKNDIISALDFLISGA